MALAEDIKQKALQLGFDLAGITTAQPIDSRQVELLAGWLKAGYNGQMGYMHRNFGKRINPARLLDGARSVICVGLNYRQMPSKKLPKPTAPTGRVAAYAQYEDYHLFMKKQLRKLAVFLNSVVGPALKFKICVDSTPLAERALAARAGLGFIGRNHMLINPKLGPQILLGEIITNIELRPDEPAESRCTDCQKCIAACPTGALGPNGSFDANKCISYLTIECEDEVSADLAEKMGDRIFGCDECVLACPYQEKGVVRRNEQFKLYPDRARLNLKQILGLSKADFEAKFADSPIKRTGIERLKRNVQICLANLHAQKA